ncbi:hypothetical protein [Curtobacterium sp. VKM Ac-2922]|uniref:hypothetical protein n=1 Tax=Curtobacterium sp. VKM Ac-2922 TaxID=2929475 RepID=UPI001FB510A6|nr:hypothetical protein [Curtobacterium sp. VKM Ac-2922]MCJ1715140.1 hypothetical protein [Curtobacterium sp. VKM Ac-2922]
MPTSTTRTTAATLVVIAVVIGVACWAIGGAHAPDSSDRSSTVSRTVGSSGVTVTSGTDSTAG